MSHFSDTFRVKVDADTGTVRLSVRSVDERVDEHIIDVRDFNAATQEVDNGWVGTDVISTKQMNNNVIIAIKESNYKRIIYQVTYQHWRIVCEQFISSIKQTGIDIKSSIIRERVQMPRLPIGDIVGAVQNSIFPFIEDQFEQIKAEMRMQLSNINVTYSSSDSKPQQTHQQDEVVFIPTDLINSDLDGDVQVASNQSSSSDVSGALEALRKLKGDKQ